MPSMRNMSYIEKKFENRSNRAIIYLKYGRNADYGCSKEQESEVDMHFSLDRISQCSVCRSEYTSFHFEVMPACKIYVCQNCLAQAEDHFTWVCLNCGRSYLRQKSLVMNRIHDYGLKEAAFLYENRIIHGIDACIHCGPGLILEYTGRLGECAP